MIESADLMAVEEVRRTQRVWHRVLEYRAFQGVELQYAHFVEHRFVPHTHEEYQIAVLLGGTLRLRAGGADHDVGSLAITAINPGEVHGGHGGKRGWQCRNFYVPASFLSQLGLDGSAVPGFSQAVIQDLPLARALVRAHTAAAGEASALTADTLLVSGLGELFSRYATCQPSAPSADARSASRRARDYIHAHFADRIRLDALASVAGLSPYHFLRCFKRDIGMPPHAYQNQIRLAYARRRLLQGASAAGVAAEAGFADQSHLIRELRRTHGVTPSLLGPAA